MHPSKNLPQLAETFAGFGQTVLHLVVRAADQSFMREPLPRPNVQPYLLHLQARLDNAVLHRQEDVRGGEGRHLVDPRARAGVRPRRPQGGA